MENEIIIAGMPLVPVVLALSEAVKRTGLIPSQYTPLVSVVVGMLAVMYFQGYSPENILAGILLGLSASGLYSGARAVAGVR